jgi:hypothetical protein
MHTIKAQVGRSAGLGKTRSETVFLLQFQEFRRSFLDLLIFFSAQPLVVYQKYNTDKAFSVGLGQ